jgi:hypothetical protein
LLILNHHASAFEKLDDCRPISIAKRIAFSATSVHCFLMVKRKKNKVVTSLQPPYFKAVDRGGRHPVTRQSIHWEYWHPACALNKQAGPAYATATADRKATAWQEPVPQFLAKALSVPLSSKVIVKKPKKSFWVSFWAFVHPKLPCFTVFPENRPLGRKNQKSL